MEKKEYILFLPLLALEEGKPINKSILYKIVRKLTDCFPLFIKEVFEFIVYYQIWCIPDLLKRKKTFILMKKLHNKLEIQLPFIEKLRPDLSKLKMRKN